VIRMSTEMTTGGKDALVRILPSCGGTMSTMWHLARMIRDSKSMNLREILGGLLDHPDSAALGELVETCEKVNDLIDMEGVITHFASYEHLSKFDTVTTVVAAELPEEEQTIAHTLLPLTLIHGGYSYENDDVYLPISGLVQIGPSNGTPYAHLASVIWLEDGGLSARIMSEQAGNGVVERARKLSGLDYGKAPRLTKATIAAKEALKM